MNATGIVVERHGQGDGPEEVAALVGYHDAVHQRSLGLLAYMTEESLGAVIDTSYTPPVTRGVRLISVLSDNLQHAGQARYLRGIVNRVGI